MAGTLSLSSNTSGVSESERKILAVTEETLKVRTVGTLTMMTKLKVPNLGTFCVLSSGSSDTTEVTVGIDGPTGTTPGPFSLVVCHHQDLEKVHIHQCWMVKMYGCDMHNYHKPGEAFEIWSHIDQGYGLQNMAMDIKTEWDPRNKQTAVCTVVSHPSFGGRIFVIKCLPEDIYELHQEMCALAGKCYGDWRSYSGMLCGKWLLADSSTIQCWLHSWGDYRMTLKRRHVAPVVKAPFTLTIQKMHAGPSQNTWHGNASVKQCISIAQHFSDQIPDCLNRWEEYTTIMTDMSELAGTDFKDAHLYPPEAHYLGQIPPGAWRGDFFDDYSDPESEEEQEEASRDLVKLKDEPVMQYWPKWADEPITIFKEGKYRGPDPSPHIATPSEMLAKDVKNLTAWSTVQEDDSDELDAVVDKAEQEFGLGLAIKTRVSKAKQAKKKNPTTPVPAFIGRNKGLNRDLKKQIAKPDVKAVQKQVVGASAVKKRRQAKDRFVSRLRTKTEPRWQEDATVDYSTAKEPEDEQDEQDQEEEDPYRSGYSTPDDEGYGEGCGGQDTEYGCSCPCCYDMYDTNPYD